MLAQLWQPYSEEGKYRQKLRTNKDFFDNYIKRQFITEGLNIKGFYHRTSSFETISELKKFLLTMHAKDPHAKDFFEKKFKIYKLINDDARFYLRIEPSKTFYIAVTETNNNNHPPQNSVELNLHKDYPYSRDYRELIAESLSEICQIVGTVELTDKKGGTANTFVLKENKGDISFSLPAMEKIVSGFNSKIEKENLNIASEERKLPLIRGAELTVIQSFLNKTPPFPDKK